MRRLGLAVLLVAAACTGSTTDTAESATTTDAPVAEPTTAATSTTVVPTTTTSPATRGIGPGTQFEPRTRYRGRLPVADIQFELEFQLDGWRVFNIPANTGDYILMVNKAPDLATGAAVTVMYWMGEQPVTEVAAWYRSQDPVEESTEPQPVTIAGSDALQFDLLLAPDEDASGEGVCSGLTMNVDNMSFNSGHFFETIEACTWVRAWVVQVDEFAVSVYLRAARADRFGRWQLDPDSVWQIEDFQPLLDDFIGALSFCTTANPCDD